MKGRKSKYNEKMVDKICQLIESDSYTILEICKIVGISKDTYYTWQATMTDFSDRIKKAHETRMQTFVAEAKKSLLKKIQGYTIQEKHTTMVDSKEKDESGKSKPKIKEQKIIDKYFQPDTAAIIFTLTNGDPDNWRNRHSSDISGTMSHNMSKEAAAEVADLMQKFLKTSENADKH